MKTNRIVQNQKGSIEEAIDSAPLVFIDAFRLMIRDNEFARTIHDGIPKREHISPLQNQ